MNEVLDKTTEYRKLFGIAILAYKNDFGCMTIEAVLDALEEEGTEKLHIPKISSMAFKFGYEKVKRSSSKMELYKKGFISLNSPLPT